MNIQRKVLSLFAAGLLMCGFVASAHAHNARVLKVSGDAEITLPGETAAKPLTPGTEVPQGATISTGDKSTVDLETFPGAVATINANASVVVEKLGLTKQGDLVTSQEALLDLKKGNVVSTIDPTKRAINHYGVRTPKGVAAARGTVFGVSVQIEGTTVATMHGTVTINLPNGSVQVPFGQALTNDQVTSIAAAAQAAGFSGTVAQLLNQAVSAVATNVATATGAAGSDSSTATSVLAAVVSAA